MVAAAPAALLLGMPYLLSLFQKLAILAIAAAGLNLVLGYAGLPAFGHGAFVGIGSYTVGILAAEAADGALASAWLQFPLAALVAGLAAALIGAISLRTRGVAFLMITLAFGQMLYFGAVALERYGGDDGMIIVRASAFGDFTLARGFGSYVFTLAVLAVVLLLMYRVTRSPFGFVLRGAAANERRMLAVGVAVPSYRVGAFALSGAICGVAGVLWANYTAFLSPAPLAWTWSVQLAVMVLLGGAGTLFGPLFGAAAFVLLEEVLTGALQPWRLDWHIVFGPLLLLVVLAAPGGIAGLLGRPQHG